MARTFAAKRVTRHWQGRREGSEASWVPVASPPRPHDRVGDLASPYLRDLTAADARLEKAHHDASIARMQERLDNLTQRPRARAVERVTSASASPARRATVRSLFRLPESDCARNNTLVLRASESAAPSAGMSRDAVR
jgi:hypothetical protein